MYDIVRVQTLAMIVYSMIKLISKSYDDVIPYSNYVTIILQSITLFILTFVCPVLNKLFKIELPLFIEIMYLTFTTFSILFGEIFNLYVKLSWWDDLLHTFSGSFVSALGFIIIYYLNAKKTVPLKMTPFFVVLFSFGFSMSVAVLWEIFEYFCDGVFGGNMQRFMYDSGALEGSLKVGRIALGDTMSDLIECVIGSIILNGFAYLDMKLHNSRLKKALKIDDESIEMENITDANN